MSKLTKAKMEANQRWNDSNPEKMKFYKLRSTARSFMRVAEADDFKELMGIYINENSDTSISGQKMKEKIEKLLKEI